MTDTHVKKVSLNGWWRTEHYQNIFDVLLIAGNSGTISNES